MLICDLLSTRRKCKGFLSSLCTGDGDVAGGICLANLSLVPVLWGWGPKAQVYSHPVVSTSYIKEEPGSLPHVNHYTGFSKYFS